MKNVCKTEFQDFKSKICKNVIPYDPLNPPGIRVWCDDMKLPRGPQLTREHLNGIYWIGDTVRKVAICMPLKSGSTSIIRMWLALNFQDLNYLNFTMGKDTSGKYNSGQVHKRKDYPILHERNFNRLRIGKYPWMRFLNVRHPFDRLYSGWKDKFGSSRRKGPYFDAYYEKASGYKTGRDYEQDYEENTAPIIGFEQWLMFLVDNEWEVINDHFKPIAYFCSPCEINFDYVMDQEDLKGTLVEAFNYTVNNENLTWHSEVMDQDQGWGEVSQF